jgi:acetyltransferase-like isoleucine patch superfamily enzyme
MKTSLSQWPVNAGVVSAASKSPDFRTKFNLPTSNVFDRIVRRFGMVSHVLAILLLYAVAAVAIGFALAPALWFFATWQAWVATMQGWPKWIVLGIGFGCAFFIAGFALLLVVPIFNLALPTRVKPFKGGYYSAAAIPWYLHNGLFYLVRLTFLPFVTLTPFGLWFLQAMRMRIGQRVFINSEFISDPQLITLGDDVVIGGSVHLFAHYGGAGHLIVSPIVIGNRVTIGQKATVMGDVQIADNATILPHAVLLPGSRVGSGETWGGVPARRISRATLQRDKRARRGESRPVD